MEIPVSTPFWIDVWNGVEAWMLMHRHWRIASNDVAAFPGIDGLHTFSGEGVLCAARHVTYTQDLINRGIPVVPVTAEIRDLPLHCVAPDYYRCGLLAGEHLIETQIRQFALCARSVPLWGVDQLFRGFQAGIAATEVVCDPEPFRLKRDRRNWTEDRHRIAEWLHGLPKPVGILCESDAVALEVHEAAAEASFSLPDDIAIMGYGDAAMICNAVWPPISSVNANGWEVGFRAAARLEALMRGEPDDGGIRLIPPRRIQPRGSTDVLATKEPRVRAAIRFLDRKLGSGITVEHLLQHVKLSRKGFELILKRETGMSPGRLVRWRRINRVRSLLRETDLSMSEVAEASGYSDQTVMGQTFKREVGMTPSQYRKEFRGATPP